MRACISDAPAFNGAIPFAITFAKIFLVRFGFQGLNLHESPLFFSTIQACAS